MTAAGVIPKNINKISVKDVQVWGEWKPTGFSVVTSQEMRENSKLVSDTTGH